MTHENGFFVVWCYGGGTPTVAHEFYSKAMSEAQRLARQNPGKRFVVMSAVRAFVKDDLREIQFVDTDDQIPF